MSESRYTTEILRLAASLRDPQALEREDGVARLRSPTCGSRIETIVALDSEGRVQALSQVVLACAFGQASAALLERGAGGRSRDEMHAALSELGDWLGGGQSEPHWPGIGALGPARERNGRHGAILLPFRALLAAMDAAG